MVTGLLGCEYQSLPAYEACEVEHILTPLGVAFAFGGEVVLDYECAFGCGYVCDCGNLLEFTHDLLPESVDDGHDLQTENERRADTQEHGQITALFFECCDAYERAKHEHLG